MDKLKEFRKQIDSIDEKISKLIEKRIEMVRKIFDLKEKLNLPLTDKKREEEIIENLKSGKDELVKLIIEKIYPEIFEIPKKDWLLMKKGKLEFKNIGIIGLGLIGGSIIKCLKIKNKEIKIYSLKRNNEDTEITLNKKYIDEFLDLKNLILKSELIILATPIEKIIGYAKLIKKDKIDKKLLIIDVGSTKNEIGKVFEKLSDNNFDFIPTHPLAGSEKSGFKNSNPYLFLNFPWLICYHSKNQKENLEKIKNFVEYLGAKPIFIDYKKHDEYLAYTSHLVFILAKFLFLFIYQNKLLNFTGTGFMKTTYSVSGNPKLHYQILKTNRQEINKAYKKFLNFFKKNNPDIFNYQLIKKLKKIRDEFFSQEN